LSATAYSCVNEFSCASRTTYADDNTTFAVSLVTSPAIAIRLITRSKLLRISLTA